MPASRADRSLLPRPVHLVGWTALAFAGLTLGAAGAHAEDAPPSPAPAVEHLVTDPAEDGAAGPAPDAGTAAGPGAVTAPDVEDPAVEQPVVEQPVVVEEPVVEQPVIEQPVVEEPVAEEPAAGEPEPGPGPGPADDAPADPAPEVPVDDAPTGDPSAEDGTADGGTVVDGTVEDGTDENGTVEDGTEAGDIPEDPAAVDPVDSIADSPADVPAELAPLPVTGPATTPAIPAPTPAAAPAPAAQRVTTSAAPARAGFTDVPSGMMYAEEIRWMQREGYATGWPDGTYRPLQEINRDAFVVMLFRVHAPTGYVAPTRSRFSDVGTGSMYYREISWAASRGITTGWSDGTFRPLDPIDRDAALAMLQRAFGGGAPAPARSPFLDVTPQTQHYDAMAWGYANGVTTGWADGTFRPGEGIHRDAMAVMIHRLVVLGPDAQRGLTAGPTGAHWSSQGGNAAVGAPTGYRYRFGAGLRQDFARGSILYSPTSGAAVTLTAGTQRLYDSRGGLTGFGLPTAARTTAAGTTALQFERGGIYTSDGYTFVVTGDMFRTYTANGGLRGYLGAPIGDQRTGSSGITYQSFKGGQLTSPTFLDTPPPTTVSGGTRITYRTLTTGSRGDDVHAVQVKIGVTADGVFGAQTREAVMRYQREQGIPVTGIVDTRTWARIMSVPNQRFDGTNGRLAAHELTIVAPNWTLPNAAASAYTAMHREFTAATGLTFTLNDAYRPIDRQIQLLVALGRPTAAFPGTSPHGDARRGAVDIQVTRGDVTHRWLLANAARFGFGQTAWQAANEPWHWERR